MTIIHGEQDTRDKMKQGIVIPPLFITAVYLLLGCTARSDTTPIPVIATESSVIFDTHTPEASCSVISVEPTPVPDSNSYFPPVSNTDFSFGPISAPVTVIEYCDFQSGGCKNLSVMIATLVQNRQDVRFVFRPFPLIGVMDKSDKAVLAALAADEQDKFWIMYDLLFVMHDQLIKLKPAEFNSWVIREAAKAGIDGNRLRVDMNAPETATRMMSMYETAKKLNIPAVPLVLINGSLQPSYLLDYQSIAEAVGLIALGEKQFSECPPFSVDAGREYLATIHTEKGEIVIQLYPDKAPLAVNSFVFLAREGWFDGIIFHRVISGFAAQSGDPSGTGKGNPGYFFKNEINDLKYDRPGRVGMANSGPDTNGSQFFITFAPAEHLNGVYTIFGQVTSGLDVAEKLTLRDPDKDIFPARGDIITGIEIEEK